MRHSIHTGKKEPMTSTEGARTQPVHRRLTPMLRESAVVLFIVADRPEVGWEKVDLESLVEE
jgi:hypothetical protein